MRVYYKQNMFAWPGNLPPQPPGVSPAGARAEKVQRVAAPKRDQQKQLLQDLLNLPLVPIRIYPYKVLLSSLQLLSIKSGVFLLVR